MRSFVEPNQCIGDTSRTVRKACEQFPTNGLPSPVTRLAGSAGLQQVPTTGHRSLQDLLVGRYLIQSQQSQNCSSRASDNIQGAVFSDVIGSNESCRLSRIFHQGRFVQKLTYSYQRIDY